MPVPAYIRSGIVCLEQFLPAGNHLLVHLPAGELVAVKTTVGQERLIEWVTLGIGKIPAVLSKHLALGLSPGICVVIDHAGNTRIVCLARAIGAGENPIENQITERPQIITVLLMLLLDLIKLMDSTTQCLPLLQFLFDNGLQAG